MKALGHRCRPIASRHPSSPQSNARGSGTGCAAEGRGGSSGRGRERSVTRSTPVMPLRLHLDRAWQRRRDRNLEARCRVRCRLIGVVHLLRVADALRRAGYYTVREQPLGRSSHRVRASLFDDGIGGSFEGHRRSRIRYRRGPAIAPSFRAGLPLRVLRDSWERARCDLASFWHIPWPIAKRFAYAVGEHSHGFWKLSARFPP